MKDFWKALHDALPGIISSLVVALLLAVIGAIKDIYGAWFAVGLVSGALVFAFLALLILKYKMDKSPLNHGEQKAIIQYLQKNLREIMLSASPGSTTMLVGGIIGKQGLFVSPPWATYLSAPRENDLVDYLIKNLEFGKRTLLLGRPGQGKTTTARRVFFLMVEQFVKNRNFQVPIMIPLRTLYSIEGSNNLLDLKQIWKQLNEENTNNPFPLTYEKFLLLTQKKKIVFIFDGFDEIPGELGQKDITRRSASPIFEHPSILTCRTSFYEQYLGASLVQEMYTNKLELLPFEINNQVIRFIDGYCAKNNGLKPKNVIKTIKENQALQDLAQRPLLIAMILETFDDLVLQKKEKWTTVMLYEVYTAKWLRIESSKPDSILAWDQKKEVIEEVAWILYCAKTMSATRAEIYRLLREIDLPFDVKSLDKVVDDLCLRSFLIGNYGGQYYFIHKSFQDYYVSSRYFKNMLSSVETTQLTLSELIAPEISTLLRDYFETCTEDDRDKLAKNLMDAYLQNSGNEFSSLLIRQHAGYNLARTVTKKAENFLERMSTFETNKWVQRGMLVGLITFLKRKDILEYYMDILNSDPEAASVNTGYYLVYCGDQNLEDSYRDLGNLKCGNTIRMLVARLSDNYFSRSLPIELFTLRDLIRTRGLNSLSEDQQIMVKNFLLSHRDEQPKSFERERQLLLAIFAKSEKNNRGIINDSISYNRNSAR